MKADSKARRSGLEKLAVVLTICTLVCAFPVAYGQDENERLFWESVDCANEAEIKLYMEEFPGGAYFDEAVECLRSSGQESHREDTAKRLRACESHINARRLTTGAGGNAFDCYRNILKDDPGNQDALTGIQRIENTYARWARTALNQERIDPDGQTVFCFPSTGSVHVVGRNGLVFSVFSRLPPSTGFSWIAPSG